jgi:hypothetical protein
VDGTGKRSNELGMEDFSKRVATVTGAAGGIDCASNYRLLIEDFDGFWYVPGKPVR